MLTIIIVNILTVSLDIVSVDLHFEAGSYHSWLQLKDKISKKSLKITDIENFNFSEEKEETINKLIRDINEKVATGEDNISAKLIKYCNEIITPYITKIINLGYKPKFFQTSSKKQSSNQFSKKAIQTIFQTTDLFRFFQ